MCFFEICFYNDNSVPENNDESHRKRGYRILDRLQKNLSFLFMILTLNYVLTYRYRYKSKILVTYRLNLDQNQIKLWSIRIRPGSRILFSKSSFVWIFCVYKFTVRVHSDSETMFSSVREVLSYLVWTCGPSEKGQDRVSICPESWTNRDKGQIAKKSDREITAISPYFLHKFDFFVVTHVKID